MTGTVDARVRNNTIGVSGTPNSGSSESNGIFIFGDGGSKMNMHIGCYEIWNDERLLAPRRAGGNGRQRT